MRKIEVKNTFYRSDVGTVQSGDVIEVDDKVAESLVEEKGYADYAESEPKTVTIQGAKYPENFVNKNLPEGFPHFELIAEDMQNPTFKNLLELDDLSRIKNVGGIRAEEIEEGIQKALDAFVDNG